jgi:RiboL-PSP-HEPN
LWNDAWPSGEIATLKKSLDEIVSLVRAPARDQPDEVTRALARFLVVRTCGYLEQVVEECCRAYLHSKSAPAVASFGRSWLGRGSNPTPDRLEALTRRFDAQWATELRELLERDDQLLSRELALLVDRRNKIAHGLSEGLGARKALDLVDSASVVASWFVHRLDPR